MATALQQQLCRDSVAISHKLSSSLDNTAGAAEVEAVVSVVGTPWQLVPQRERESRGHGGTPGSYAAIPLVAERRPEGRTKQGGVETPLRTAVPQA